MPSYPLTCSPVAILSRQIEVNRDDRTPTLASPTDPLVVDCSFSYLAAAGYSKEKSSPQQFSCYTQPCAHGRIGSSSIMLWCLPLNAASRPRASRDTAFFVLAFIVAHALSGQALQAFPGEAVDGFDGPCSTEDSTGYGSGTIVVASKPSSDADIGYSEYGLQSCPPLQICGTPQEVETECRKRAGCAAFNYDGKCGLLKTEAGPRIPRGMWTVYVLEFHATINNSHSAAVTGRKLISKAYSSSSSSAT